MSNGRAIRANSGAAVEWYGVLPERVRVNRDSLAGETVERIGQLAGDLYERAAAAAVA